jgi:tRNA nucleotidyltransferase (CCA-adding enzyme)
MEKHIDQKKESPMHKIDIQTYRESIKGTILEKAFEIVTEISAHMKSRGGNALLVGGSVRDMYFGKISKDYDLEVYGVDYSEINKLIHEYYPSLEIKEGIGVSFGITKVFIKDDTNEKIDIDFSVPRRDSKISEGHKGFDVQFDKNMSIKDAARRRDFTFNTLAMDPTTGEVFDYYNGVDDIQNKILRVTDKDLFRDDPLRVARGMQFVGRFGLVIDQESKEIIKETATRIHEVSKDRFYDEFEKLLLKSEKPSLGLVAALELGIFEQFFPHFLAMKNTPQEQEWHPEGDVWTHTLMVVDEAAKLIREHSCTEEQKIIIMLSALLHDIGKPETTYVSDKNQIVSPGHEKAGEIKAREFLKKINAPIKITEKVVKLVTNHMMPGSLYRSAEKGYPITENTVRRLAKRLSPATIEELILVSNADSFGRGGIEDKSIYKPGEWLIDIAKKIGAEKKPPDMLISGKDLRELGFPQGEIIGKIRLLTERIRGLKETLKKEDSHVSIETLREDILHMLSGIENTEDALEILRNDALETIKEIRIARKSKVD